MAADRWKQRRHRGGQQLDGRGVAHHQQTVTRRQRPHDDLREFLQSGTSGILDIGALEDVPQRLLLRNQIDGLAAQRMVDHLQTGLGGGA